MRLRNAVLLLLGIAAAVVLFRRREIERVDVHFDDGSAFRFTRGHEARDLLDDAHAILESIE
jgi:hypothetical protein